MSCVEKTILDVVGISVYTDDSISFPVPFNVPKHYMNASDIVEHGSPALRAVLSPVNGELELKSSVSVSLKSAFDADGYKDSIEFDLSFEKDREKAKECAEKLRGVDFHVLFDMVGGNRLLVYAIPNTAACETKDVLNGTSSLLTLSFSLTSFSSLINIIEDIED